MVAVTRLCDTLLQARAFEEISRMIYLAFQQLRKASS